MNNTMFDIILSIIPIPLLIICVMYIFITIDYVDMGRFLLYKENKITDSINYNIKNDTNIVIYKVLDNGELKEFNKIYIPVGNYILRHINLKGLYE